LDVHFVCFIFSFVLLLRYLLRSPERGRTSTRQSDSVSRATDPHTSTTAAMTGNQLTRK